MTKWTAEIEIEDSAMGGWSKAEIEEMLMSVGRGAGVTITIRNLCNTTMEPPEARL